MKLSRLLLCAAVCVSPFTWAANNAAKAPRLPNPRQLRTLSLRHWFHDHVDASGVISPVFYSRALDQRAQMPPAILTSPNVSALVSSGRWEYVGPHNQDVTIGGLYDGLPPVTGRVNCVAIDPTNSSNIYVGAAGGGVWKSIDAGVNWTPLSDAWPVMQVSALAIDPTSPATVYAGTGDFPEYYSYSTGLMKSTNGGATWTNYGKTTFAGLSISKIAIDPANPQILLATAGRGLSAGTGSVFRSTDGGQTWAATDAPAGDWDDLDVSLPDGTGKRTFWAVGEDLAGAKVYRSINEGLNWTKVATPIAATVHQSVSVSCSKINPATLYILDPDTASAAGTNNHIWKSVNGGTTWTDQIAGFPNGDSYNGATFNWSLSGYAAYIRTAKITTASGPKDGVFVGLSTLAFSLNGGVGWKDIGLSYTLDPKDPTQVNSLALTHANQHGFIADALASNTFLISNDGGVHRVVYDPVKTAATFTPLNANLNVDQFYTVYFHPTDQTRLAGGAQDNASPTSVGDLANWTNPGLGDGGYGAYDPFNPLIAYNSTHDLVIFQTTDGWNTLQDITDPSAAPYASEPTNFLPPIALANNNGKTPSTLYAGTDHLWKWDSAHGWVGDLGGKALTTATLRVIATCPADSNRLYTGGDDGQLWVTPDLGATWRQIDGGFSQAAPVASISSSPSNAKDVLAAITQSGPGVANLWHCSNTDAASPVWVSVSGSGTTALPNVPVNAVARDPFTPATTWYAGTDYGVFMTNDSGVTWRNMTQPLGLPNVAVNDLEVNAKTGYLYAATYGRGIWRIKLVNPASILGLSLFVASASVYGGNNLLVAARLTQRAPVGGFTFYVTSDSPLVNPPAKLTVPFGSSYTTFQIPTTSVALMSSVLVHLTATAGSTRIVTSTAVWPSMISALLINPSNAMGGTDNPTGTIALTSPAPPGMVIMLYSNNPAVASVPGYVIVPVGARSATFAITTTKPQAPVTVTITASRTNVKTATVTVN